MQDGGGDGSERWSVLERVVAGEVAVAILVLAFAWWPSSGDAQSPLGFVEGVMVAAMACVVVLPFLTLFAVALSSKDRTLRVVLGIVLGVLAGIVTVVVASVTALLRLEDQHEA